MAADDAFEALELIKELCTQSQINNIAPLLFNMAHNLDLRCVFAIGPNQNTSQIQYKEFNPRLIRRCLRSMDPDVLMTRVSPSPLPLLLLKQYL